MSLFNTRNQDCIVFVWVNFEYVRVKIDDIWNLQTFKYFQYEKNYFTINIINGKIWVFSK